MKLTIPFGVLLGILLITILGLSVQQRQILELRGLIKDQGRIIRFDELQQQLVDRGYPIKVDGKICKGWDSPDHSETITAWNSAICQDYADLHINRKTMGLENK